MAQVLLNLSTITMSGMSVLPVVRGSSGGDVAGRLDPCCVITCATFVFPLVLGSSGSASDLRLAGVADVVAVGIALGGLILCVDGLLAAGIVGIGAVALDDAGAAPAGAATGNVPPLVEGAAFARLWALSCRALA